MSRQTSKSPENHGPSSKAQIQLLVFVVLIIASILALSYLMPSGKEITWQEFEQQLIGRNAVERIVVVNKEQAYVYIKRELSQDSAFKEVMKSPFGSGLNSGPHYHFNVGSVESFERKMDEIQQQVPLNKRVPVRYEEKNNFLQYLSWLLPLFIMFWVFRMLTVSRPDVGGSSSAFNFGRSTARLIETGAKSAVTFEDVAGLEEAKQEVKEIVDFLKSPGQYTKLGAKIPKGMIIVGPPGTGKTLLAKAVAGEAKVPFFSLSGSEFVEMFVGVGASRVRDLFKRAKEKAPCIVFIDEIDAVGRSRGRNALYSGANDERESTLNQLLTEMDGFGTNTGVIVLAATNRADILDPALLRPGRFDRHIYLELPTQIERREIFKVHLKPLILDSTVDVNHLASQTPGFSGADIANICNEAALIAARRKKDKVDKQDFLDAIDRIIAGLEKKSKIISPKEKKIIAYHEAGHALVSWLLQHIDPLVKVSIIPRGKSLGAAWYLPEERQIKTFTHLTQQLVVALAGRASEEVVFDEISSGAVDDLEKVTKEAYAMVVYFGFNKKVGHVSFYDSSGKNESGLYRPYSEDTARLIDEEVRRLIETSYQQAKTILNQHLEKLKQLAELLLKKEIVYREEIEQILGKRLPFDTVSLREPEVFKV